MIMPPIPLPRLFTLLLLLCIGTAAQALDIRIRLVNGLSGIPLEGMRVDARRVNTDGSSSWVARGDTGADGRLPFSLADGGSYFFTTRPYGQRITSPVQHASGELVVRAGLLPVTLINGLNGAPLAHTRITLQRLEADGKFRWAASGTSDEAGGLIFEPAGIEAGIVYRLKANSPVDGSTRYSAAIGTPGKVRFVVGNTPLNLTLVDAVSAQPLSGVKLVARERLPDGSSKWIAHRDTDAQGMAVFDLEGLGSGRIYFVSAYPYAAGSLDTPDLNAPGDLTLRAGVLPVSLVDAGNGQALGGVKLSALELLTDGRTKWRKAGTTDEQGVVRFDPPGLGHGSLYTIRAHNPLGQGKSYYSPWIGTQGPFRFEISQDGEFRLDKVPPEVSIGTPAEGALVATSGFLVSGRAADKHQLDGVDLLITDPLSGASRVQTQLGPDGAWTYRMPAGELSANQDILITAIARDRMGNTAEAVILVRAVDDRTGPTLLVDSPASGSSVPASGFFVRGKVTDNTGALSLTAHIPDLLAGYPVEVASGSGRWAFSVPGGLDPGTATDLILHAEDTSGNVTKRHIGLQVLNAEAGLTHLFNRISFGATPDLLVEAEGRGWDGFVQWQLHPEKIDDSSLEAMLTTLSVDSSRNLQLYQLMRAVYSRRQLSEVMTWFWDNHFNTYKPKHGRIEYELAENQAFRANALGRFRDLLAISAHSPAMLIYLDNVTSRKQEPNENYARELLELHSMGVDNGYTAQDIAEVARAFTGWRVKDRAFYFDLRRHDDGEKRVLGHVLPAGGGMEDGELVLDILAAHPSTAQFICSKLSRLFIADEAPADAVNACATVFLDKGGDIRAMVNSLLQSHAFTRPGSYQAKVKTPLELITAQVRGLDAHLASRDMLNALNALGMPLFYNPLPTGWAETGEKWVSSSQMLSRIDTVHQLAFNRVRDNRTHIRPAEHFRALGLETAQGIVDHLLHLMLANDYSTLEREIAYAVLNGDPSAPFDLEAADADERLRALIGAVLSFPAFSLQ